MGDSLYSAKLVDLPCVVESQKTLDNKQMFKVADICQVNLTSPDILPFTERHTIDAGGGRADRVRRLDWTTKGV